MSEELLQPQAGGFSGGLVEALRRPREDASRSVQTVRWATAACLVAVIAAVDLVSPPDVAVPIVYGPVVILAMWFGGVRAPLHLAFACGALTAAGWAVHAWTGGGPPPFGNRVLAFVGIMSAGVLCAQLKRSSVEIDSVRLHRRQLKNLLHSIDLPIVISDADGRVKFWNGDAERRYGYAPGEIMAQDVSRLFARDALREAREVLSNAADNGVCSAETTRVTKAGRRVDVQMTAIPLLDGFNGLAGIATIDRDRSHELSMVNKMQELALYDSLTSLPNRRCFYERLDSALGLAARHDWILALLFFDLDGFKQVNDSLGHGAGDRLLCQVSERLMGCVRRSDYVGRRSTSAPETTISRLGGDEFTVILNDVRDNNDAARTAKRMLDAISAPIDLEGHEVSVSSSVGIAVFPYDGEDAETLIRNADTAMYHAKDLGRGRCAFYSEQMNEQLKRRLDLAARLRHALEQDRLHLHYQPVHRASDGSALGAEVLLRWDEPGLGPISPVEFIPIAEETGLIDRIGDRVLRTSCMWAASWARAGHRPLSVAVNVSTHQLRLDTLTDAVKDALDAARLAPELLTLEITESAVIEEESGSIETIDELRALGVRVSLDDFGTGYSSLSRLRRLRLDGLKIDRSFISEIGSDTESTELVAAIIAMAHVLGLEVVAEGVETHEQLAFLRYHGCDAVQGYLLGRPVDGNEFERLMGGIGELPRWPTGFEKGA
ncbi:MAG: putative bifunctional diguanylate cyclase/phosphodiesterase [Myxococcota bacterium]